MVVDRKILFLNRQTGCILLCICMLLLMLTVPVSAADPVTGTIEMEKTESKTVRVGWYEDSYHITDRNGDRSGYGYEYEQAVSAYTGWDYDYVTGNWEELLKKLQDGEIDLMGTLSYTDERA